MFEHPGVGNVVECKRAGVSGGELTRTVEALESSGIAVDGIIGLYFACLPRFEARLEIDAMIRFENGGMAAEAKQIEAALRRCNLMPDAAPLRKDKTMKAAKIAGGAALAAPVAESMSRFIPALPVLDRIVQWIRVVPPWVWVALVLPGFYRAGLRSAEAAATRQAIDEVRKNQLIKEAVDEEIRRANVAGRDARERMRSEWYRD